MVAIAILGLAVMCAPARSQQFSTPKNVSNNSDFSFTPQLAVDLGGNIYVVWEDDTDTNSNILFSRSTDGGVTFSAAKSLSNTSGSSFNPRIAVDAGGSINVVWQDSPDFFGTSNQGGYNNAGGLLRLRTAHAALTWKNTEAFIEYDRSILSPNTPSSLTALAVPALSWSGNLWSWNPQIGLTHQIGLNTSTRLKLQAALIDVEDAPSPITATNPTTLAELSRWPGSEARIALAGGKEGIGPEIGIGGYFSPHRTSDKQRFDAWAGTLDLRLPLPARLEFTGSAFRGQALGGLGAGAYKDYIYNPYAGATEARALDDVGGWAQLKERASARLEFNLAYGIDNAFASQVRPYIQSTLTTPYLGLIRNQTYFTNVIYSPNAYLLFSLEYRHLQSTSIAKPSTDGNVVGVAAAYKF